MRPILIIVGLLLYGTGFSQLNSDTIIVSGYEKLKQIPTCIGVNCFTGQSCSVGVPAGSSAAYLLHEDIRIGKIKHSKMICEFPNGGVCSKMSFVLNNEESVSQAGKQAAKQFGEPVYTKEGNEFVYTWMHTTPENQKLNIRLEVAEDMKQGMLYVE